jgi:peptidoglycan/xylan/chitin deacetylase (PgdA/CDA1 family)
MRPSIIPLLRRARRLGSTSPFSGLIRYFSQAGAGHPIKHIKIDDEEQQSGEYQPFSPKSRAHPPRILRMVLLTLLILIAITSLFAYTIYKPPKFIFTFMQWKNPDVLFQVSIPSNQKVAALTLDDAPSSETTRMLDLLKTYGAKATFFIIGGQTDSYPGLVQRMHDEGHETGNHAWFDEPSIKLPLSELERQIKEVDALLPQNSNSVKYFRPGSGFWNGKMLERVKSLGYRVVLGCIYPHDPQIHSAKVNSAHVLSMVRPGGVIIMHDRRPYSADQLELVLKGLTAEGWKILSLGGLLQIAEEGKIKTG